MCDVTHPTEFPLAARYPLLRPRRKAGQWRGMPLGLDTLSTVGFLFGVDGRPLGSCFVVWIDSTEHGYLVTAGHVVEGESEPQLARFRHVDGTVHEHEVGDWIYHDSADVAVTPLKAELAEGEIRYARSMDSQAVDAFPDFVPLLGTEVFYAGLFGPAGQAKEWGVPMVRSGSVGMLYTKLEAFQRYREPFIAHLIDTRSYGGFSGSPVWVQYTYPAPRRAESIPTPWFDEEESADLGTMVYALLLLGIFLEHYEDDSAPTLASNTGVGIVLPVEYLRHVLMKPELVQMRRDEDAKAVKPGNPTRKQASGRPKAETVDLDARVSLEMDPEDALRVLLDTPPDPRS